MIRHIVALNLASDVSSIRQRCANEARARLEALHDVDPGVLSVDVHFDLGVVAGHWPLVLVADCETALALDAYQAHPRHQAVVQWLNSGVVSERAVVDYEVP